MMMPLSFEPIWNTPRSVTVTMLSPIVVQTPPSLESTVMSFHIQEDMHILLDMIQPPQDLQRFLLYLDMSRLCLKSMSQLSYR